VVLSDRLKALTIFGLSIVVWLILVSVTSSHTPEPLSTDGLDFRPVPSPSPPPSPPRQLLVSNPIPSPSLRPSPSPSPSPAPSPRPQTSRSTPRPGGPNITGTATWFCNLTHAEARRSRCRAGYPDIGGDQLYAAVRPVDARHDRALVCFGKKCVEVTIIDCLCHGGPNIIDLYSDAFRRLAPLGRGRITVTVTWR
jgi:hypothetical protein